MAGACAAVVSLGTWRADEGMREDVGAPVTTFLLVSDDGRGRDEVDPTSIL